MKGGEKMKGQGFNLLSQEEKKKKVKPLWITRPDTWAMIIM